MGISLYEGGRETDVPRATQLLNAACCNDDVAYCSSFAHLIIKWKRTALYGDARTRLERACQAKDQESCQVLASAYDQGLLGVTDPERAMALYSATCDQHHLPSCDAKGHMYLLGRGHVKAVLEGLNFLYGTCAQGYGPACDSMGQAAEDNLGGPAGPAEALPYYEHGCALGSEHACQRAHDLGSKN